MEQLLNLLKTIPEYKVLTDALADGKNAAVTGIGQIEVGVGLGAYTDFDPGELLGADLLDDGLDAVVSAGGSVQLS